MDTEETGTATEEVGTATEETVIVTEEAGTATEAVATTWSSNGNKHLTALGDCDVEFQHWVIVK